MKIFFYAPMKPLGHPTPSGDLSIATGLVRFLASRGHEVKAVSTLRSRGIVTRPREWPRVVSELARARRAVVFERPDLWLSYHSYYKAPDLLGPFACKELCPYVIFQGAYSTKVKRRLLTAPGFYANRHALKSADHVFENRIEDLTNVLRLLPESRVSHVAPGIFPADFEFSQEARENLRKAWGAEKKPVVLSAAMFRPGVKTQGLALTIRACAALVQEGLDLLLVIAGAGEAGRELSDLARVQIPGRHLFLGHVLREEMAPVYSAADVFAFPGIRESLGMVFLEAQSCGLPVVAFENGGVPEVVANEETGFLTTCDLAAFSKAVKRLCRDPGLRHKMGVAAAAMVRERHDLHKNYRGMEERLFAVVRDFRAGLVSARRRF